MLYLIISTPNPSRPEDVKPERVKFWTWIKELESKNTIICCYPRIGRGVIAIFDVPSNDELHYYMTQWTNLIPVSFDIYPLASPSEAKMLLK